MNAIDLLSNCEGIFTEWKGQPIMIFGKISYALGRYQGYCEGADLNVDYETVEMIKTRAWAVTFGD